MKQIIIVFAVFAVLLAMFVSVFAQAPELPAIDAEAAEPYLGTWHIDQMCFDDNCVAASSFGLTATLEVNDDNTMTMTFGEEEPSISYWYMEDGAAYIINETEEGQNTTALQFNEEGLLVIGDEDGQMTFKRESDIQWGSAEMKTDAVYEDFEGEWHLNSMASEGLFIPASLFGLEGKLVIREDSLDFEMSGQDGDEYKNVPYELKDGAIYAVVTTAENTENILVEYHMDNSVIISFSSDEGTEMSLVLIREEDLSEGGLNLIDLLSGALEGVSEDGSEEVPAAK